MSEKKDFFETGMFAPFGDGTEIEPCELYMECIDYKRKRGYEKLCKECKAVTPEAMKEFIPEDFYMDDEPYYCYWCDFIRKTGIDGLLVENEKKESAKEVTAEYDEDDDGSAAMWELEDAGAFSDEGIMPGCHSGDWEYRSEMESIEQEFKDMAFVGNSIKLAREKAGLSIEVLADRLDLPKSFLEDIERGEYINRYGEKTANTVLPIACPVSVAKPIENSVKEQTKGEDAWWQDCGDGSIKEKVAEYLCCTLNPNTIRKCDKNAQFKAADSDDLPPF